MFRNANPAMKSTPAPEKIRATGASLPRQMPQKRRRHRCQVFSARIHRAPGSAQRQAFDIERDQPALSQFRRHRLARQNGDAQTGDHAALDRLQRTELLALAEHHLLLLAI